MIHTSNLSQHAANEADRLWRQSLSFTHPDDVLHSPILSIAEKRAILAAWASDLHAVPNLPTMRQLDSGTIVPIEKVLDALRSLDERDETAGGRRTAWKAAARSRVELKPRRCQSLWRRNRRDDDDPPPSPAAALPPGIELMLRRRRDLAWGLIAA